MGAIVFQLMLKWLRCTRPNRHDITLCFDPESPAPSRDPTKTLERCSDYTPVSCGAAFTDTDYPYVPAEPVCCWPLCHCPIVQLDFPLASLLDRASLESLPIVYKTARASQRGAAFIFFLVKSAASPKHHCADNVAEV